MRADTPIMPPPTPQLKTNSTITFKKTKKLVSSSALLVVPGCAAITASVYFWESLSTIFATLPPNLMPLILTSLTAGLGSLLSMYYSWYKQREEMETEIALWQAPLLQNVWEVRHRLAFYTQPKIDAYWQDLSDFEIEYQIDHTTFMLAGMFAQFQRVLTSAYMIKNPTLATNFREGIRKVQLAFATSEVQFECENKDGSSVYCRDPNYRRFLVMKGEQTAIADIMLGGPGHTELNYRQFVEELHKNSRVRSTRWWCQRLHEDVTGVVQELVKGQHPRCLRLHAVCAAIYEFLINIEGMEDILHVNNLNSIVSTMKIDRPLSQKEWIVVDKDCKPAQEKLLKKANQVMDYLPKYL